MLLRMKQMERLKELKSQRNEIEVQRALTCHYRTPAETNKGNLLELAVEAARVRATLGEISMAIEKVAGRHKAVVHIDSVVSIVQHLQMNVDG